MVGFPSMRQNGALGTPAGIEWWGLGEIGLSAGCAGCEVLQHAVEVSPRQLPPAHHDPSGTGNVGDVLQWVAVQEEQVGTATDLNRPPIVCRPEEGSHVVCACPKCLIWGESGIHKMGEFFVEGKARGDKSIGRVGTEQQASTSVS